MRNCCCNILSKEIKSENIRKQQKGLQYHIIKNH
jgi:hypothetical protein